LDVSCLASFPKHRQTDRLTDRPIVKLFNVTDEISRLGTLISAGSLYGPAAGSWEHGAEHSGPIKGGEFL